MFSAYVERSADGPKCMGPIKKTTKKKFVQEETDKFTGTLNVLLKNGLLDDIIFDCVSCGVYVGSGATLLCSIA